MRKILIKTLLKNLFLTLFSPLTLVNFYGVIIVNMLKKTLASLFAASAMLAVAQSAAADIRWIKRKQIQNRKPEH